MKNPRVLAPAALIAALLAALLAYVLAQPSRSATPSTDDAFVYTDYTLVAPRVAGQIAEVAVEENQRVKAGQLLARIDDRDYQAALQAALAEQAATQAREQTLAAQWQRQQDVIRQAEATLKADQAALAFAGHNAQRYRRLANDGTGTVEEQQRNESTLLQQSALHERDAAILDGSRRQLAVLASQRKEAEAASAKASHALEQARLQLSYTTISAPVDGVVGQRSMRVGGYVGAGTMLLALVPLDKAYVLANYRETQLGKVRAGQQASLAVDAVPGITFRGHVESIAPATALTFAPIAPDNATGNFTKVVQRLPVKILLDADQPHRELLRVGMSVIATIDTRSSAQE